MKKVKLYHIFLSLMLIFVITGCEKDKKMDVVYQDVVFGVDHVAPFTLKESGEDGEWDWKCGEDLTPVKAHIVINGEAYYPEVFFVGDKLYTQSIKLAVNDENGESYTVSKFLLLGEDDNIIMATPSYGSEYADYVSRTVDFSFTVNAFEKAEEYIEVLCFKPEEYDAFGFTWFNIDQIVVKEICFFGDICANIEFNGSTPFPPNGEEPGEPREETAWGGDYEGDGAAFWWYFDTDGPEIQDIKAGSQGEVIGEVTYREGQFSILLYDFWHLQSGSETIKIEGYDEGELPLSRPAAGNFTYKGNDFVVNVDHQRFFAIHLDVEYVPVGTKSFDAGVFAGSLYEHVVNGIQLDMPAIFKLNVYKNGQPVPHSPFSNIDLDEDGNPLPIEEQTLNENNELDGTNKPVCARYPVHLNTSGQEFVFELYLWVPDFEGGFHFQLFYTFTAEDMGPLMNEDGEVQVITGGLLDFVLGNCLYQPADLNLNWPSPDVR